MIQLQCANDKRYVITAPYGHLIYDCTDGLRATWGRAQMNSHRLEATGQRWRGGGGRLASNRTVVQYRYNAATTVSILSIR